MHVEGVQLYTALPLSQHFHKQNYYCCYQVWKQMGLQKACDKTLTEILSDWVSRNTPFNLAKLI